MVSLPKYHELMFPTLRAIAALGGSASIEEIQEKLIEDLGFSEEQLAVTYPKSGAVVLPDRMSWARSYLRAAGLLENPRKGVWVLTEEGRAAAETDVEAVRQRVRQAHRSVRAERQGSNTNDLPETADDPSADIDWSDELLEKLRAIEPAAFERLSQRLLRESGFVKVEVTGKSGDGGIDGTGVLRVNLISFHVLFQCKRYQGSVGAGTIRDFRGAMQGRADKGLVITTGTFTGDARREATRDGAPAIDLIDGEALCALLKDLRIGVNVKERIVEDVSVDVGFFDSI